MYNKTTLEEYRDVGRILTKLNYDIVTIGVKVSNQFGKSKFNLQRSYKEMLKLRSDLEERMFAERPDGFEELSRDERINIFYGDYDGDTK